jgi:hypothetical protein
MSDLENDGSARAGYVNVRGFTDWTMARALLAGSPDCTAHQSLDGEVKLKV